MNDRSPAEVARVLAQLTVSVSSVRIAKAAVALAGYPGGARPSSVVCVAGDGHRGFGENVAFTASEHDAFATSGQRHLNLAAGMSERRPVSDWLRGDIPRYERAALEAALVDLGLRQAGLRLADVAGGPRASEPSRRQAPLRVVTSFGARTDPRAEVRRLRATGATADLKIDVDPDWDDETRRALAQEAGIAILDFKGRGDAAAVRRWGELLPDTIFEDPPPGATHALTARDASLVDASAVSAALARNEAINLKAPRMGGPLELLRGLDHALQARGPQRPADGETAASSPWPVAYVGGMFEVGVGRAQARQLAALYCPDAPNDLAAIDDGSDSIAVSPLAIWLDTPGFGGQA